MKKDLYTQLSWVVLIGFAIFPLLFSLPYRIHLDLPWEGTYRLYLGQIPFKDFSMPFGYGFFILPLLCFYILGPSLKTLIIAQSIMTLISGLTFLGILKKLGIDSQKRFLSMAVFCMSYTFIYFWPWYNNTAFNYEIIGLYFLLCGFDSIKPLKKYMFFGASALFTFLTFFTKQDYGGLALAIMLLLCFVNSLYSKKYTDTLVYIGIYGILAAIIITPLLQYDFKYWFNLGQPPHESRLSIFKILDEIFNGSSWEKFYILILLAYAYIKIFIEKSQITNIEAFSFLITISIVGEAMITKTTSGNATASTTYYHGFAIAFILNLIGEKFIKVDLKFTLLLLALSFIWFSADYWKYINRMIPMNDKPSKNNLAKMGIKPAEPQKAINWVLSDIPMFKKVKLPEETIEGLKKSKIIFDSVKSSKPIILNMTELTMLAHMWGYEPIKGIPLWYHLGIGMFQSQVDDIIANIDKNQYDMVLFETIPHLDNFFPYEVYFHLQKKYRQKLTYLAPNKDHDSHIHIFVRK